MPAGVAQSGSSWLRAPSANEQRRGELNGGVLGEGVARQAQVSTNRRAPLVERMVLSCVLCACEDHEGLGKPRAQQSANRQVPHLSEPMGSSCALCACERRSLGKQWRTKEVIRVRFEPGNGRKKWCVRFMSHHVTHLAERQAQSLHRRLLRRRLLHRQLVATPPSWTHQHRQTKRVTRQLFLRQARPQPSLSVRTKTRTCLGS
jgi:hypothetical protein